MSLPLGTYRHYKGNFYEVIGEAKHSETEELFVIYKPLYGGSSLWIRPYSMFIETVVINGIELKRFEKVI